MFWDYFKEIRYFMINENNGFGMSNFILLNEDSGLTESISSRNEPLLSLDKKRIFVISNDLSGDNFSGIKIYKIGTQTG